MPMRPGDRQRAREFAVVLDKVGVNDLTMAPWTRVATALSAAGGVVVGPSEEFRFALRQRLLAVGAVTPTIVPTATPAPWRRRLVAAGVVVAVATGGAAATAAASEHALPGDRLYDVKRAMETMQLALANSDLARGERYLSIASTRLGEVQAMLRESDGQISDPVLIQELRDTMSAMSDALAAGSERFFEVFNRTADAAVMAPLERFLAQRSVTLDEVRPMLPAELWQSQDTLVVEMDTIAARVATVTGHPVAGISAPSSALNADLAARASRSDQRDTLARSVTKAVRDIDKAVADARRNAEAAAKPQPKSAQQVAVERNVHKLVYVDLLGNGQASVGALPGGIGQHRSVSAVEQPPPSAAIRLFGLLPLPFDSIDTKVPGSLSASLDFSDSRAGSKQAHMHLER
jgi:hypothetical protein